MKFFHQRNETVHVGCVLFCRNCCNIFVTYCCLHIIRWKKLIVPHVVFLQPHERCIIVRLGVTVSLLSADFNMRGILLQPANVFLQLFVILLLRAFAVTSSGHETICTDSCGLPVFFQSCFQIFYGIFFPETDLKTVVEQYFMIHLFQQLRNLCKNLVSVRQTRLLPYPGIPVGIRLYFGPVNVYVA